MGEGEIMEIEEIVKKMESKDFLEFIKKELEKFHADADEKLKEIREDCDCMRKY